ncbi:MAG TPA: DUF3995 domain-containing protein [Thermomicrobiales bacterium]|nr:DUF3995 domain-containing protein [Thermomicrobiales bacterium]
MSRRRQIPRIAALVAIGWGIGTGLLSVAWAMGSDLGVNTLGTRIQEQAREREPAFIATVGASAVARLLVAVLGAALLAGLTGRHLVPRRVLLALGYAGGAGLTLYGAAGITQAALALAGVIDIPPSMGEHAVRWYLLLWEPLWLVAGFALLAAADGYRRVTRDRQDDARATR